MFSIFNVTKLIVIIYDGDLWCELNYLFMTLFDKKNTEKLSLQYFVVVNFHHRLAKN